LKEFNLVNVKLTKYCFFTGKGGVGKTSLSSSLAVNLADSGKKVLLLSTDPASNLQDIFKTEISNKPEPVKEVPNLFVLNIDPEKAAAEYRKSVLAMYKGLLPEAALVNMEEQLSGSCTTEIAAFNEFTTVLTNEKINTEFDYIIFDTAPTGHTLRMLELPAAWDGYIEQTGGNASCLGQLSGLVEKKQLYENSVSTLKDKNKTTMFLVTRPQKLPIDELLRTSHELKELNINNQTVIFNYVLKEFVKGDKLSESFYNAQHEIMNKLPSEFQKFTCYLSYLKPYNIVGIDNIRNLLKNETADKTSLDNYKTVDDLVKRLIKENKKIVFTMGKGGVGKSTIAADIAVKLSEQGKKVHLTTTDPAAHVKFLAKSNKNLRISEINAKVEIERYKAQIIAEASKTLTKESLDYIKEDLMSPCTEEIAVFKAFADIIASAGEEIVVIDTAPTGHTLLLLDTTQSYAREAARASRHEETNITKLLPRLRDKNFTEIIIVTLAEATPYFESMRLKADLKRAEITCDTFVINSTMAGIETKDKILQQRAAAEKEWINKIAKEISNVYVVNYKF